MMGVYADLEAVVLPTMTAYQTDLTTHDRNAIEADTGCPFLHYATDSNTVIVFLPPADDPTFPPAGVEVPYLFGHADREHLANEIVSMGEYHCKACNRHPLRMVHHFDGRKLRRVDVYQALHIAKKHRDYLRSEWDYIGNVLAGARRLSSVK